MNIECIQLEFARFSALGVAFSGTPGIPEGEHKCQSSDSPKVLLPWLAFGL